MKKALTILVVVKILLCLTLAPVSAEGSLPVAMDKMVVTATMTPKTLTKVPGAFEVITAEEIRLKGAQTLDEVLEDALGVVIQFVAGRGMVPQIRGLSNKRTLVLIYGMRFSTGFRDTTIDLSEFSTEFVERIEIIRGSSSALYGSEAIGGVINIITKNPPPKFSGSVSARYGVNTEGEAGSTIVKGTTGDDLLEVPEVKSHLRLSYLDPGMGLKANIRMNYIGPQLIASKLITEGSEVNGYTMWDFYVGKTFKERFEIFAGMENIFDKVVRHTPSRGAFYYGGVKVTL